MPKRFGIVLALGLTVWSLGIVAALGLAVDPAASLSDRMMFAVTLAAAIAVVVVSGALVLSLAVDTYLGRKIVRARTRTSAYEHVRQDFEWKNKLFHRKRHHPVLPPTEVDPDVQKIQPFVPLKRPVKRG